VQHRHKSAAAIGADEIAGQRGVALQRACDFSAIILLRKGFIWNICLNVNASKQLTFKRAVPWGIRGGPSSILKAHASSDLPNLERGSGFLFEAVEIFRRGFANDDALINMRHFGAAALSLELEKKSLTEFGGGAPFPDRPGVLAFSTHYV
jgi:hypothetical protein